MAATFSGEDEEDLSDGDATRMWSHSSSDRMISSAKFLPLRAFLHSRLDGRFASAPLSCSASRNGPSYLPQLFVQDSSVFS